MTDELLPIFLNLTGRMVVLVGGGRVAAGKLHQLLAAGARVRVIAPDVSSAVVDGVGGGAPRVDIVPRAFVPADLDSAWLVVAAATPAVNRQVADACEKRHLFVNAVDDPGNASAFLSGVVRRDGVTVAISTSGDAPALTSLLREALDAVLPRDLAAWMARARTERIAWKRDGIAMDDRKPRLLQALNELYPSPKAPRRKEQRAAPEDAAQDSSPAFPWLHGPEDSWL